MLHTKQKRYCLRLLHQRWIFEKRIDGDRRFEVRILRAGGRYFVSSNGNCDRRSVEVEKGMNKVSAWDYLSGVTSFEQPNISKLNSTNQKMRIDFLLLFEDVFAVDASAQQYLKCAGKRVLMNAGGAVEPIVRIDIKPGSDKNSNWRISKARFKIHLLRQIGS